MLNVQCRVLNVECVPNTRLAFNIQHGTFNIGVCLVGMILPGSSRLRGCEPSAHERCPPASRMVCKRTTNFTAERRRSQLLRQRAEVRRDLRRVVAEPHVDYRSAASTRATSSGRSTPRCAWAVWMTRMRNPFCRARSCSSDSARSRSEGGIVASARSTVD